MRFLRRSLVGIFLLATTLALLALAGQTVWDAVQTRLNAEAPTFPQRERVLSVNVVRAEPSSITPELSVFGQVRPRRTLELRSGIGGTVLTTDPALVEGGAVTAGQVLLTIDPVDAQAALDRARADLQDARAELADADRSLALAGDDLVAAIEQEELRTLALTRAIDLQSRGAGTAATVEAAELAASAAKVVVLGKRQALAQAQARLDQAATRLDRAGIGLGEAERMLADTRITAPFDGILSGVAIIPGGRVTANELIAQLVDPTRLEVVFRVSVSQYSRLVDAGGHLITAPVTVAIDVSDVSLIAQGQIDRESAGVGEGQTGRELFALLDTAPGFRPGDFVTVSVAEPELSNVVLLPATALAADGAVLVVGDGDRLEVVPVTLLRRQGDDVIVAADGLNGRKVVAERSPLLGAGIKVLPIEPGGVAAVSAEPEMIVLDAARRAKLVAFVQGSRMPDDAKARLLSQLEQDEVPAETIIRLESRMGT
jgi:RND family efflux transporter MFP subunit